MKAYKFKIYPNKEQTEKLEFALDTCRQAYNMMLQELNEQVIIDKSHIQAMLPDMKICEPKYKKVYSKTLQYECYRLFSNLSALSAIKKKRRKVGRLRFKGKGWFKTINYNQSGFKLDSENNKIKLSKIGNIKIKIHREVEGNIKQVTIKKSINKWYVSIITDTIIKNECGDKILGIDLGIQKFIVDSENNVVENPLNYTKHLSALKKAHKNLSKKKKGSQNRNKAKIKLAKLYEKINNSRDDFLHKTSINLVKKSKIIVIENLNIKQMMEQKYFNAKNIADSSWRKFIRFLTYKAESAGCKIIKVNPKNTSKICSQCGNIQDMPLHKRTYECENCGLVIDRDYNSAKNILRLGISLCGDETSTPSEQVLSEKQEGIILKPFSV